MYAQWNGYIVLKHNKTVSRKSICARIKFNIVILFWMLLLLTFPFYFSYFIRWHGNRKSHQLLGINICMYMNDRNINAFCYVLHFLINICGQHSRQVNIWAYKHCSSVDLTHITLHNNSNWRLSDMKFLELCVLKGIAHF